MNTNYTTRTQKKTKKGKKRGGVVADGNRHLSLSGYLQRQVPDVTLIRMVYSDYRSVTAAGSQANYVYKVNSCFDPDFTGVGGQPDGFDQWKTLYSQYRVVACRVRCHVAALAGAALCTITPSVSSSLSSSAEENIGLRRSKGALANVSGQVAKMSALYRTGDIFGVSDQSVLDEDNYASSITGSPSSAVYCRVECETSGATDAVMVWTVLEMFTRFEKPVDTVDSLARRRAGESVTTPGQQSATRIPSARLGAGTVGAGASSSAITARDTGADERIVCAPLSAQAAQASDLPICCQKCSSGHLSYGHP
jgi:hypothetical protein